MIAAELRRWRDYVTHFGPVLAVVVGALTAGGIAAGHLILAVF